jgi:hypothetical protein
MHRLAILLALALLAACGDAPGTRAEAAAPDTAAPAPGPVDSTFTPEENLRRFREGLAEPRALEGGAESRDALVRGFVEALARGDTAALLRMHVTRAEFAYLYYPESQLSRPDQYLDPKMVWLLTRLESEKGLNRLMQRLGGRDLELVGTHCKGVPAEQGPNRLWEACRPELRNLPPGFRAQRLFGTIVEREGRFKFLSYKTDM